MNLRSLRGDVGHLVRVRTDDNSVVDGVLTRATRSSIELRPASGGSGMTMTLARDTVQDVELRYAQLDGFIPHPGSTSDLSTGPANAEDAVSSTIAIYACVRLIAGSIGAMDCGLFRVAQDVDRQRVDMTTALRSMSGQGYPGTLARLIGEVPNPEQSPVEFWETVVGHIELGGESFVNVVRGSDGRPSQLWALRPDRMEVARKEGRKAYLYTRADGRRIPFAWDEIMHIPGLSFDGMRGISPIAVGRNTISTDQAAGKYVERFYRNNASPSVMVTIPKGPQERFKDRTRVYREAFEGLYAGSQNAGRIGVIEEGISWEQMGLSMADQQFMQQRQWSVAEIARLYGVPPHLIGDVEKSTSWGSGIEEQTIGFVTYTLRPILEHMEAAMSRDLGLVPGQRTLADEGLAVEFDVDQMLRADIKTRFDAYALGIQWGFLTSADARKAENLPAIPGLEVPIRPVNYAPLGMMPDPNAGAVPMRDLFSFLATREAQNGKVHPEDVSLTSPGPS